MQNNLFGVIDIGSNTIRLVLFKKEKWGVSEEQNLKIPARVRSFMTGDNIITEDGIEVILNSLKKIQEVTRQYQVEKVDAVATAAIRQASNRESILIRIKEETGFTVRILSEKEEAYYGYLSVTSTTNVKNGYTIDMGGGSTEVTLIQDGEMVEYHSFPFGALSLYNKFIKNETPGSQELEKLKEFIHTQFSAIPWMTERQIPLVGMGGSARNMALIHHYENNHPLSGIHHYEIPAVDIGKIFNRLLPLSNSERKKVDGLSKDRADIIIPAIYTLNYLTKYLAADSFIMCRKGVREGVLFNHLSKTNELHHGINPRVKGLGSLIAKYGIDQRMTELLSRTATMLLKNLKQAELVTLDPHFTELMVLASQAFYLGEHLEKESSSQHTFYIISNTSLEGMNHKYRVTLALLASYKSHSNFKEYMRPFSKWYTKEEKATLEVIGSVLKLSYFLNITKRPLISSLSLNSDWVNEELTFVFNCTRDPYFEEAKATKHKKHLEKRLNKSIHLRFRYT